MNDWISRLRRRCSGLSELERGWDDRGAEDEPVVDDVAGRESGLADAAADESEAGDEMTFGK
jgi:hypothetical protein